MQASKAIKVGLVGCGGRGSGAAAQALKADDFSNLTAMADVFFPRVWLARATRVPAGTVSMTVYYHASAEDLAAEPSAWLLAQARAQAFAHGFADQSGQLWSASGRLLASTHQTQYYKE